jgi:hypothetical protein
MAQNAEFLQGICTSFYYQNWNRLFIIKLTELRFQIKGNEYSILDSEIVRSYLFNKVVQNLISCYIKWGLFEYTCINLTGPEKSEPINGK